MNDNEEYHLALDGELPVDDHWQHYVPDYSTEIAFAWQVEDRIKELGLRDEYIDTLVVVVHNVQLGQPGLNTTVDHYEMTSAFLWLMVHATPEQRCIAALMAKRKGA